LHSESDVRTGGHPSRRPRRIVRARNTATAHCPLTWLPHEAEPGAAGPFDEIIRSQSLVGGDGNHGSDTHGETNQANAGPASYQPWANAMIR
jgi:hypothetical protein